MGGMLGFVVELLECSDVLLSEDFLHFVGHYFDGDGP